jgi:hypothetical protein
MRDANRFLFATGGLLVVVLEGLALASWQGWLPRKPPASSESPRTPAAISLPPVDAPIAFSGEPPAQERPIDAYYRQLRAQVRWVPMRVGRQVLLTPDPPSRVLLAKAAARRARLHEVGLGFEDVYGIIDAESSWAPRDGASRDGTPNLGVAQFEPATAAALGVRDPHDVVEAVHAAAEHMREAAVWSASRIAGLRLGRKERADRLREGVSVYYNLSSRGRALWDGRSKSGLPAATHTHIRNARRGAQEAAFLEAQWRAMAEQRPPSGDEAVLTAAAKPRGAERAAR